MAKQKETKQLSKSKTPAKAGGQSKWLPIIVAAAITLFTYLIFSPSLKCDFAGEWDDKDYVTDNPLVVSDHIPVKEIFHTPVSLNYHPITMLTLAYNYQHGKLNPEVYHAWNVMLHVLNTLLVFLFVYMITRRSLIMAAVVSVLFGIHPMHVESVTWVAERKDVLYVFFFMAGLTTYLKYIIDRKIIWYFITLILFILSCLSKAMAVVFPIILMLVDYYYSSEKSEIPLWKRASVLNKIPFFIVSLIIGMAAYRIQHEGNIMNAMELFTLPHRALFACFGAVMYIVKLLIPVNLSAFYSYPPYSAAKGLPAIINIAPVFILIIIGVICFFFRKKKEVVFGALFYIVSVALVLQFISVGNAIMADRYTYLSSIGFFFIIAYIVELSSRKGNRLNVIKYPVWAVFIVITCVYAYKTNAQIATWKNGETLWTNAINLDPNGCYTGYANRGMVYQNRGDKERAMADYNKSIEINPSTAVAYLDRGALYSDMGKDTLALNDLNKSIELINTNSQAYYDRGRVFSKFGKDSLAILDFDKSIELNPRYAYAYMNRANSNLMLKKYDLAIPDYEKAIECNPELDLPYYNRGVCYYNKNDYNHALEDFTKAISMNQSVPQYFQYRALTYTALGKTAEAAADDAKANSMH